MMLLEHDSQADVLYLRLKKGRAHDTLEIGDGLLVDVDKKGNPLGIEILFVSRCYGVKDLTSITIQIPAMKRSRD